MHRNQLLTFGMGADDHARPLNRETLDAPPDLLAGHGVETGSRLVEENQARRMDQRRGQLQPARSASGELSRRAARVFAQPEIVNPSVSSYASSCHSDRSSFSSGGVCRRDRVSASEAFLRPCHRTGRFAAAVGVTGGTRH